MEITQTGTGTSARSVPSGSSLSSDFDTFLKMLTTQMKNQDPLNPIDSGDYAVQLATFSGVEQQTRTNQLLETMQAQFGLLGMAQMSGWVGHEARAEMPMQVAAGAAVSLAPNPARGADRVVLVVTDADGTVVNRVDLAPDTTELDWTPVDVEGAPLPDGTYDVSLENYQGETRLEPSPVEVYGRILEVRGGTEGLMLMMAGGAEIPVSAVTALRE
ncbi:flagellar hook capping FlgD N-terminal domain-containing protein [Gemmobacter sp. LW-1]|uniref:flagellar hook capping FlgD N-terminal domain-containing protein n=1 Tax=Gemmobacter sp. LW-1 TaxID=1529005 RepID=UPI0006C74524|nr:flagellar hook capping FlgD N-terminal domain-containing protein [Gemmobacter sp. LW-1]